MPLVPAMYSVEITVEKDKVTGETRVLSSTTLLPREPLPQGIKVYEDETKGTPPPPHSRYSSHSLSCSLTPLRLDSFRAKASLPSAHCCSELRPSAQAFLHSRDQPSRLSARCWAGLRESNPH